MIAAGCRRMLIEPRFHSQPAVLLEVARPPRRLRDRAFSVGEGSKETLLAGSMRRFSNPEVRDRISRLHRTVFHAG